MVLRALQAQVALADLLVLPDHLGLVDHLEPQAPGLPALQVHLAQAVQREQGQLELQDPVAHRDLREQALLVLRGLPALPVLPG